MSLIATLQMDSEEIKVLQCSFRFTQMTDAVGRPNSIPQGGLINVVVETDGSTELFEWMIHPTLAKSGTVTFYRSDAISKLKTITFIDAVCVDYQESFDFTGENPIQIQLGMSARILKMDDIEYKNNWPDN